MAITAYFFRLSTYSETEPAQLPSAEALHRLSEHLRNGEWLCVCSPNYCDVYYAGSSPLPLHHIERLLRSCGIIPDSIQQQHEESDRRAVAAFLRTAAGVDSERDNPHNTELYQEAFVQALELGFAGPVFQHLLRTALQLSEKVRTTTEFTHFAVRTDTAIRELAEKILGNLSRTSVCVVGYSNTAHDIIVELRRGGTRATYSAGELTHTQAAALLSGILPVQHNTLPQDTDILIACEESAAVEQLLGSRSGRRRSVPLLLFDLTAKEVYCRRLRQRDDLYLYGRTDIRGVIDYNRNERRPALQSVERIVEQATTDFYTWLQSDQRFEFAGMLGSDMRMQRIFQLVERIAPTDITVLIDGESGTGKELVAKAIHNLSTRARQQFHTVNCGAIPENLIESELFGHVRGAFTGAVNDKQGLFEAADNSTVFLDEIGELPLHLQVKLLRFLQEGEIRRVGSNTTVRLNVRVIAATNRNLLDMIEAGLFRSDLYYRLNVIQITLPPLRERRSDIPLMANHFLKLFARKMHRDIDRFSPEAMEALSAYHWPGNIRELENVIERAVALSIGRTVSLYNLPETLRTPVSSTEPPAADQPDGHLTLKDIEKKHILETLESCNWNYESASRMLGIGRTTLWRKLREYGYSPE